MVIFYGYVNLPEGSRGYINMPAPLCAYGAGGLTSYGGFQCFPAWCLVGLVGIRNVGDWHHQPANFSGTSTFPMANMAMFNSCVTNYQRLNQLWKITFFSWVKPLFNGLKFANCKRLPEGMRQTLTWEATCHLHLVPGSGFEQEGNLFLLWPRWSPLAQHHHIQ